MYAHFITENGNEYTIHARNKKQAQEIISKSFKIDEECNEINYISDKAGYNLFEKEIKRIAEYYEEYNPVITAIRSAVINRDEQYGCLQGWEINFKVAEGDEFFNDFSPFSSEIKIELKEEMTEFGIPVITCSAEAGLDVNTGFYDNYADIDITDHDFALLMINDMIDDLLDY